MQPIDLLGACLATALLAALPLLHVGDYLLGVLTLGLIYGIWAAGWDFMSGLTGRVNFGYGLFIGLGAYVAGFANTLWQTDPWFGLPMGIGIGAAAALIVGIPTLRLRGPYFALAMLAATVVMERLVLILWRYTGGDEGLNDLDPLVASYVTFYYIALAVLVASVAILLLLARSRLGIILRAIRGDEAACLAAGLNVTFYKIVSLMISAAFGGLGGTLYAHYQLQVSPQLFSMQMAMTIITIAYVGGLGSIYGPVVAAIVLTIVTELLRPFGAWRLLIYSILLILALFLARDGLVAPAWQALRRILSRQRGEVSAGVPRSTSNPGTST